MTQCALRPSDGDTSLYEFKSIIAKRIKEGEEEYKVRWHDSWVPVSNFTNPEQIADDFERPNKRPKTRPTTDVQAANEFSAAHILPQYRCRAEVRNHPRLQGQHGLFATDMIEQGEVVYVERVPLLDELSPELERTDHYIAVKTRRAEKFAVLKDDAQGVISISYFLNSPFAPHEGGIVLDSRGPNVYFRHYDDKTTTFLSLHAKRRIERGNELLWIYDSESDSDAGRRFDTDDAGCDAGCHDVADARPHCDDDTDSDSDNELT